MSIIPIDYRTRHPLEDRREQLAGQVEQYLAGGGHITELPGFEYKPFPPSRYIEADQPDRPKHRPAGRSRMTAEQENAIFRKLEPLQHLSMTAAMKQAHVSHDVMARLIERFDLKFNQRPERPPQFDEEEDRKIADRAQAMSALGLTKNQARNRLQIGFERLNRIASKYGITFKTA